MYSTNFFVIKKRNEIKWMCVFFSGCFLWWYGKMTTIFQVKNCSFLCCFSGKIGVPVVVLIVTVNYLLWSSQNYHRIFARVIWFSLYQSKLNLFANIYINKYLTQLIFLDNLSVTSRSDDTFFSGEGGGGWLPFRGVFRGLID